MQINYARGKRGAALNKDLSQMDIDFKKNNTSDAFRCVKSFKEGFKASTISCRDSDGKLLSKLEEVKNRWVEYFNVLLNTTEDRYDEMEWTEKHLIDLGNDICRRVNPR
jgi:hypothetical protein